FLSYLSSVTDTSTTQTYPLSLHDALPIFTSTQPGAEPEGLIRRLEQVTAMPRTVWPSTVLRRFWEAQMAVVAGRRAPAVGHLCRDRKSTRLNSSHLGISYAVFCLKKKKK